MNEENNKLKLEIEELKNRNNELEEKLKSYTNPTRNKKYYEMCYRRIFRFSHYVS